MLNRKRSSSKCRVVGKTVALEMAWTWAWAMGLAKSQTAVSATSCAHGCKWILFELIVIYNSRPKTTQANCTFVRV